MRSIITKIILTLFAASLIISCSDSDNFSSDPNLKIQIPTDIISFDTVFATIASPIQEFHIYNRNKHSISFESIELMNATESGFRLNVNGQAGTAFHGEELLKKDSILILVDIKAPENSNSLIEDKIKLSWNGNTEYITLQATPINVEIWDDKQINQDMQLAAGKAYYIRGEVVVNEGANLSIDKGATLYFDQKGSLTVNGSIEAKGTTDQPITFRGHRFDFAEPGILYDNVSGQWKGITIGANSFNNLFENVRIRNAERGLTFLESTTNTKKATLINTIIHNSSETGLSAINSAIDAINCQISNSKGALISLTGGNYTFLHCTIGNYYQWHSRTLPSVILEDTKAQKQVPLNANFINSIIVGTFTDELAEFYNKDISSCTFTNCLIQTSKAKETSNFVNTQWNIGNVFLFNYLNYNGDYNYSFELTADSSAKDKADPNYSNTIPYDLRGVSRLADKNPDIGCYEWNN